MEYSDNLLALGRERICSLSRKTELSPSMARFRKVRCLLLQDTEVSCAQGPTDERENLGHAQHLPESAADGQPRRGISVVRKVKLADVS